MVFGLEFFLSCLSLSGVWEISIKTLMNSRVIRFRHGEEFTETGRHGAGADTEAKVKRGGKINAFVLRAQFPKREKSNVE